MMAPFRKIPELALQVSLRNYKIAACVRKAICHIQWTLLKVLTP